MVRRNGKIGGVGRGSRKRASEEGGGERVGRESGELEWKWGVGMGSGEWGVGSGEWGVGSGEWGVGSGEWGVGRGERGVGSGERGVEVGSGNGK